MYPQYLLAFVQEVRQAPGHQHQRAGNSEIMPKLQLCLDFISRISSFCA